MQCETSADKPAHDSATRQVQSGSVCAATKQSPTAGTCHCHLSSSHHFDLVTSFWIDFSCLAVALVVHPIVWVFEPEVHRGRCPAAAGVRWSC